MNLTKPHRTDNDTSNSLAPIKFSAKTIQKHIFADKFLDAKEFELMAIREEPPDTPTDEPIGHAAHDKYMHAKQVTRYGGVPTNPAGFGFLKGLTRREHPINQRHDQNLKAMQEAALNQG